MISRVLVVFVDALGVELASALGDRLGLGAASALTGVLGYSTGALPTVLTGQPPAVHGRMCLFARRRTASSVLDGLRWLELLPRWLHERGRVRRVAEAWLRRRAGLTGYVALHKVPPHEMRWLDLPEQEDLFSAASIGGAPTFLADARTAGLSVYAAPWQLGEAERWRDVDATLRATPPELTFLYATELDGVMHREGTAAVEPALDRVAAHIARARDSLAHGAGNLTTIIVGDHGMADIRRVIDPRPTLAGITARAFVDSTMTRLWGSPVQLAEARTRLEGAWPGRWLDRPALASRGVPVADAPFGDAIWVLPEGAMFAPSFLGGAVRGMHGYDLGAPSSRAGFLSDAAFTPSSLTEVAGLVRQSLALA